MVNQSRLRPDLLRVDHPWHFQFALGDHPRDDRAGERGGAGHARGAVVVEVEQVPLVAGLFAARVESIGDDPHDGQVLLFGFVGPFGEHQLADDIQRADASSIDLDTVLAEQSRLAEDTHQFDVSRIPERLLFHERHLHGVRE